MSHCRFPRLAARVFAALLARVAMDRAPDFVVGAGNPDGAYLNRWWIFPRNRYLNAYLHCFLRDDDDRALHDHPWWSASLMLDGSYTEHTIDAGGIHRRETIAVGALRLRRPRHAHRIELDIDWDRHHVPGAPLRKRVCWTLFVTGPRIREWGFHCPNEGFIPWNEFTAPGKPGDVGPGCDA